jgi:hypothetical protein
LLNRSWRKVCKSVLLVEVLLVPVVLVELLVLLVLLDELSLEAALSAETTLLKSDCNVLNASSVEEVEDEDELPELAPNCEINCSSLVWKVE